MVVRREDKDRSVASNASIFGVYVDNSIRRLSDNSVDLPRHTDGRVKVSGVGARLEPAARLSRGQERRRKNRSSGFGHVCETGIDVSCSIITNHMISFSSRRSGSDKIGEWGPTYGASFPVGVVHPLAFILTGITPLVEFNGVKRLLWVI